MLFFLIVLILSVSVSCFSKDNFPTGNVKIDYEKLYKLGVDAYLENRWKDCVTFIERSLEDYFFYHSSLVRCRRKCQKSENDVFARNSSQSCTFWHLQVLATEKALCLLKCQNIYFPNRSKTSKETDDDFLNKVPYNYLQLCYFKIEEPEKAASCAYTFLIHNHDHVVMQTNLQYYMSLSDLKVEEIKYLEPKDYQDLFLKGAQLYMEEHYNASLEVMEASLKEYFIAEEECRIMCEGPMPNASNEELYLSIANHLTYALRCKLNCPEKLSYMYGQKHGQLLSSHYHYLQFNYYKEGKLKKACSAVSSYLLFHPEDETMKKNKDFYAKQPNVLEKWFSPRKEAEKYYQRYEREMDLLEAIESQFNLNESNQSLTPPPGATVPTNQIEKRKLGPKLKQTSPIEASNWLEQNKIKTHMKANELNGTNRVAFTNLATEKECQQLVDLAVEGGLHGDGYNGKESPHTAFEMFEGLTVTRAAILAKRGLLNPLSAQLFMNISEKARHVVQVYFHLETKLFFSYTHLVCRTALPDSPDQRKDLSHPIHADNCVLRPNGKCAKEKPAYTWRDYSSIVYLNDDFEGGEFIFAKNKDTIQATVQPNCGLMVAFSAGKENLHGVKAVRKGRRCALAMWYTLDSEYRERERDFAEDVLLGLGRKRDLVRKPSREQSFAKATLHRFAEKSVQHTHTEL